uniref:Uncharacterized protein n=1 Tax=Oryza rufipogon TaxID=4529 RepID=A0A0E0QQV0_ORYRU
MAGPRGGGGWAPRDPPPPKRGPSEFAGRRAWREDCLLSPSTRIAAERKAACCRGEGRRSLRDAGHGGSSPAPGLEGEVTLKTRAIWNQVCQWQGHDMVSQHPSAPTLMDWWEMLCNISPIAKRKILGDLQVLLAVAFIEKAHGTSLLTTLEI